MASVGSHMKRILTQLLLLIMTCFQSFYSRVLGKPVQKLSDSALNVPEATLECRYKLGNDSSAVLHLPDGRKLGYAQYGLPAGLAILYLHGLPGSRLESAFLDATAVRLGARIIAVDRPGYGWSSPHLNRTILDHAKDVECLADHLELDKYALLGISGGGSYVLACAVSLPAEKLKAASIVCGLGPPDIGNSGMNWNHWLGFTLGWRYAPGLSARWVGKGPVSQLDLTNEERLERLLQQVSKTQSKAHPKDVEFFSDVDRMRLYLRSARESYCQGFDALAQDGHLSSKDFGFRIEDIRPDIPFQLWYGKQDTHVPLNHGKQIASRLGSRAHLRVVDETHASIVVNCEYQILEALINAM